MKEKILKLSRFLLLCAVMVLITMIPQNYVDLTDPEVVKKFTRILDLLDEDDDVQAVYHNANLPDEE